jgi:hypothetical protein
MPWHDWLAAVLGIAGILATLAAVAAGLDPCGGGLCVGL